MSSSVHRYRVNGIQCPVAPVERFEPSLTPALVAEQKKLGAQSLRKQKKADGWEVFISSCENW
jgi:hypothetical protein